MFVSLLDDTSRSMPANAVCLADLSKEGAAAKKNGSRKKEVVKGQALKGLTYRPKDVIGALNTKPPLVWSCRNAAE